MHGSRLLSPVMAAALAVTGCGGGSSATPTSPTAPTTPVSATPATPTTPTTPPASSGSVTWQWTGSVWQSSATPPACPSPLIVTPPSDMGQPTSVLYPGQSRPDYKPHAGFRYDSAGQTNAVTVVSPMDGVVFRGARFLEGGEIQYTFDLINSCGIMHRLGHLRELSPKFQAIADAFPAAVERDSRTTNVSGQTVSAGEIIATAIGFRTTNNRFFDWGVFDLRQRNARSADAAWAATHPGELDQYALCVIDVLPAGDATRVRSLPPGDPAAGRTSDFCR